MKTFSYVGLLVGTLTLGIIFQNCSNSSSSGADRQSSPAGSLEEFNTTATTSFKIHVSKQQVASGEEIDVEITAEDKDGTQVSEFNYLAQIDPTRQSSLNSPNEPVIPLQICAKDLRFENGALKAKVKMINNNSYQRNLSLKVSSAGLAIVSNFSISVAGIPQNDSYQKINLSGELPPPRSKATMIFDSGRNRILLFGGRTIIEAIGALQDGPELADLWELHFSNGQGEWMNITPGVKPNPRFGHTLVRDPNRNRLLLFGGQSITDVMPNEIWSFDLQTDSWSLLSPEGDGANPRADHKAAFDISSKYMLITGGGYGPSSNMSRIFAHRSGGSANGNWTDLGSFPEKTSLNIDSIYSNGFTKYFNPFFPERELESDFPHCGQDAGAAYACVTSKNSVTAFDSLKGEVWLFTSLAERAPASVPGQSVQQYKPVVQVYKKGVARKLFCD